MKHFSNLFIFFILLVLRNAPAHAEFSYGPFSLSAFGTLGASYLSNDHVNYTTGSQPTGPGLGNNFDLGLDSRLGLQLNAQLTPSTLITAQSVAERLYNNQFLPRLTQANLRQEIGENLAIRVGRIQSPAFLASDYRLANFSNPWVRTPSELYNLYPLTHLDSAEFTYRYDTGIGALSLNSGYGWLHYPLPIVTDGGGAGPGAVGYTNLKMDDVIYANLKLDNGPWRFKISWLHSRASIQIPDVNELAAAVSMFDPIAGNRLNTNNQGGSLYSAGFSYDSKDWLVMLEWGLERSDLPSAVFADKHGGYFTLGYHLDRWLPQITLGYQATTNRRVHSADPEADALLAEAHAYERTDYRTLALGLNYAATNNVMLRGQVDFIAPMNNSFGPYFQVDSNYNFNHPGVDTLFTLSLDFVY